MLDRANRVEKCFRADDSMCNPIDRMIGERMKDRSCLRCTSRDTAKTYCTTVRQFLLRLYPRHVLSLFSGYVTTTHAPYTVVMSRRCEIFPDDRPVTQCTLMMYALVVCRRKKTTFCRHDSTLKTLIHIAHSFGLRLQLAPLRLSQSDLLSQRGALTILHAQSSSACIKTVSVEFEVRMTRR